MSEQREETGKSLARAFNTIVQAVLRRGFLDQIVNDVRVVGELRHLDGKGVAVGVRGTVSKNECAVIRLLKNITYCFSEETRGGGGRIADEIETDLGRLGLYQRASEKMSSATGDDL